MAQPSLEPHHLRSCLSRFVTGVVVISYRVDGEPRGLTANSMTSVSLDPPLILAALARTSKAVHHLAKVPFTINVLKASQFDIAMQFGGRPRERLRIQWVQNDDELAPRLEGALASFRCTPWRTYDGGDHVLQLGQVIEADVWGEEEPLLFDRGRFAMVGLSLFDSPRVIDPGPVVGGVFGSSNFVYHLTSAG